MSDYFIKMRLKGQKLDEGINHLNEIWSAPLIHIGGYDRFTETKQNVENIEETAKANAAAEAIAKSVIELQESLIKDVEESEKKLSEMQQLMYDAKSTYDYLMQKCSDIETLFMENGYVPEAEEVEIPDQPVSESDSSLRSAENIKVESTPYIPWKSKLKTFDASTPEVNNFSKDINIKKESLLDFETPLTKKLLASRTSFQSYRHSPREPVLSRYYHEL